VIRTVVVDDEPLGRRAIAGYVSDHPDLELAGTASRGSDAIKLIRHTHPDLVALDIRMPEVDGFAVLRALPPDQLPFVIFITAYDQYSLEALEFHALGYLLKPVSKERFDATIEWVRKRIFSDRRSEVMQQLKALLISQQSTGKISIRTDTGIRLLSFREIDWVQAEGNYIRIHCGEHSFLVRETMARFEERSQTSRIVRVHRSAMVNLDAVLELVPSFTGDYKIIMKNSKELTLSRRYRESVLSLVTSF
jgi:two-component system, LytTR family, response regulator